MVADEDCDTVSKRGDQRVLEESGVPIRMSRFARSFLRAWRGVLVENWEVVASESG